MFLCVAVSDSGILEDEVGEDSLSTNSPPVEEASRQQFPQGLRGGRSAQDLQLPGQQPLLPSPDTFRRVSALHEQPSSSHGLLAHRLKPVMEVLDGGRRHSIVGT